MICRLSTKRSQQIMNSMLHFQNMKSWHGPRIILTLFMLGLSMAFYAQDNDFGLWYSVGVEKKIDKRWSVDVEGEFRTRNHARTADRWSVGVSADYKINKRLKGSAGYDFLWDNDEEKITLEDDGMTYKKWTPSYWGGRHRVHADLTGNVDWSRLNISLRERWQYTYRPEKIATRFDFSDETWEDNAVRGKGDHVLRSRLQVEYDFPASKFEPYASVELFHSWSLEQVRYIFGANWKLAKQHQVGLYYRLQPINKDAEEGEKSQHVIGLSYQFKF